LFGGSLSNEELAKHEYQAEPDAAANAGRPSRVLADASGPAWLRSAFGIFHGMRWATIFLIVAIVAGVLLPHFLQDRLGGMGITLPSWRGSSSPAADHQVSGDTVIRFLRVLGVCFALVAVFCFVYRGGHLGQSHRHHNSPMNRKPNKPDAVNPAVAFRMSLARGH
jgi:hypothetical protein